MKNVIPTNYNMITGGQCSYTYDCSTAINPVIYNRFVMIGPDQQMTINENEVGRYSVFTIANWFLNKESMTHKKLQKLCYYAQAWCYALREYRLEDTDYEAWVHGPVSPILWERFKVFGYDCIQLKNPVRVDIREEDEKLLEDVWDTYGENTGNALEALTHRELPWIKAREGYAPNERCSVVISPDTMKEYYTSIHSGD